MNRNEIDEFIEDNFGPHDKLTILELVDEVKKDAIHSIRNIMSALEEKDGLMVCHKKNLHTLNAFTDISIYVTRKICHKGLNLVSI